MACSSLVDVADEGDGAILVQDAERPEPSLAFELVHLAARRTGPTPMGVVRAVSRPVYGRDLALELQRSSSEVGTEQLHSGETRTVS